jgi:hypothetical protein
MPDETQEQLVAVITRGFANVQEQARERENRISLLSEKMIGVEFQLAQLNKMVGKVEADMGKSETVQLAMRVVALEKANEETRAKANENSKYLKGLLAGFIMLLLGFLFNFIKINLRQ